MAEVVVVVLTGVEEVHVVVVAIKMEEVTTKTDVVDIITGTIAKEATIIRMAISREAMATGITEREARGGVDPVVVARRGEAPDLIEEVIFIILNLLLLYVFYTNIKYPC